MKLTVTIKSDGEIGNVQFLDGPKRLAPFAEDAVKQWRYEPAIINGSATVVQTTVLVPFNLRQ